MSHFTKEHRLDNKNEKGPQITQINTDKNYYYLFVFLVYLC